MPEFLHENHHSEQDHTIDSWYEAYNNVMDKSKKVKEIQAQLRTALIALQEEKPCFHDALIALAEALPTLVDTEFREKRLLRVEGESLEIKDSMLKDLLDFVFTEQQVLASFDQEVARMYAEEFMSRLRKFAIEAEDSLDSKFINQSSLTRAVLCDRPLETDFSDVDSLWGTGVMPDLFQPETKKQDDYDNSLFKIKAKEYLRRGGDTDPITSWIDRVEHGGGNRRDISSNIGNGGESRTMPYDVKDISTQGSSNIGNREGSSAMPYDLTGSSSPESSSIGDDDPI